MGSKISDIWAMAGLEDTRRSISSFNEKGINVCFIVDPMIAENLRAVLQYVCIERADLAFALTIDCRNQDDNLPGGEWLDILCSLLFHSEYYKIKGNPVITFLTDKPGNDKGRKVIDRVSKSLLSQGFTGVNLVNIDVNDRIFDQQSGVLYPGVELQELTDFPEYYISHLVQSEIPISFFIFYDQSLMEKLISMKESAEARLFNEETHLSRLITLLHQKSADMEKLQRERTLIQEELSSKTAYLDFILKQSGKGDIPDNEVIKIKRFYANEYEILPRWYKRFGHIIKVMMGKRTFRSLFDHNVKKYK